MDNYTCLDPRFSTTRRAARDMPVIKTDPDATFIPVLQLQPSARRVAEGGLRLSGFFKVNTLKEKTNSTALPVISIITVTFNAARTLAACIESVLGQSYDNIEFIIIDGGSHDGTLEIIRRYNHAIDYWISEPDAGIYDAMNKGIRTASGDVISILNADDFYEPYTVELSINAIMQNNTDFSYGAVRLLQDGIPISVKRPIPVAMQRERGLQEMPFPHISMFVRRRVYERLGLFTLDFKIASDHEFAVCLLRNNCLGIEVPTILGNIELGGTSSNALAQKESMRIAIRNGKNAFHAYSFYLFQLLRWSIREYMPISAQRIISKMLRTSHEWL
jgi:glycosyltransferase involved in cell wall biosynthesis